ncbi:PREDICTED: glutamyl-tRNA(Gln) amidotransferase subunit A, mitochondrial [Ceratosolen solmsi marchali]|uniref:Glutamyl-tRNA(Gln) amidotransferase subunit A, mitochondrial n=1 Tax=Ceratosolen solmsi marchali TaxID=326594 RepID=A0AAJ6YLF9_9HYME|nr:PREDICTED: glutamyl-tRNA(Gln) amidotransferase subunit A, mitochondrial [Ceratosolen solmsi marchali]
MNRILALPMKTVGQMVAAGEIRPGQLADAALKMTVAIKPLNAFVTVTGELLKQQSRDADERQMTKRLLGDLDGIPIAIKDNFCTGEQLTTCASRMLGNFVPSYDATVYRKLKEAGAVLVGKTNLDQFAMGSGTVDSYYGPTKNLWGSSFMQNYSIDGRFHVDDIGRSNGLSGTEDWYIAGGSSGGSAIAVLTGTCYAALGSDTGGSTRNPASHCGLVGLKPTYGLVSRHGLIPLVNSMDVPGILARTVDDAVAILNTIAGPDPFDSTTYKRVYTPIQLPARVDISGLRIGIPKEYRCSGLTNEVESNWMQVGQLLEDAGAHILPVSLPHTEYSIVCYSVLNQCEVASNMSRFDGVEYGFRADEYSTTKELYAKTRSQGFNDVVRSRILTGNYFLLEENYENYFVKAMKVRRLIAQDFDKVWQSGIDLLLTPTMLNTAPNYSDFISQDNQTQCSVQDYCTQPANMAGIPAISIPIKLSNEGLPLSVQLMAPKLCEKTMLAVAKWIEDVVKFPVLVLKDDSLIS